jgi:outer membrane protein OmpA-like peptidoglycan-associated protein
MKSNTNFKKESHIGWSPFNLAVKSAIFIALMLAGIQSPLNAQSDQYTKPSWWFGGAVGANLNFYRGSTQQLNSLFTAPAVFHDGKGVGLYLAPLIEYHKPDSRFGMMLQAGYDGRKGKFDRIPTSCNCPADLSAKLTYLTIEPSIRIAPFKGDFYLYAGPRIALNMAGSFTYQQGINPAVPAQVKPADVKGDFSNMDKSIISMQIGAGYDIALSSTDKQTQYVLSPFVAFHPYFGQIPRTIETWNVTTVRIGAALKFGKGRKIQPPEKVVAVEPVVVVADPEVTFTVNSPKNIPVERRIRETFPLRNYIFFDLGSDQIPDRYVLLTKDQVAGFKEEQLDVLIPKRLSGRSVRQMIIYYNVLNILGDRMGKYPNTTIILRGSSIQGVDDGKKMAETVKTYLVDIFGIAPTRITTEGRIKPIIPSEQPGGTKELDLLREGDHRVTIATTDAVLLMEFQSGPDADVPLKPINISSIQEAPVDSYVSFNVDGAKEAFTSWSLEIRDEKGDLQNFGPYTQGNVLIPGKAILGIRPTGDYRVTMVGHTINGKTVRKDASIHMVLWTPGDNEMGVRFSVIFEFNQSDAIALYEKYLTEVVTPKVPVDATVIIHGHTDIIGDEAHNQVLSLARANDVKKILEASLAKAGRTDVKFEVYGFGEDQVLAPFENNFAEERFYNRTVIIDIIPKK